MLLGMIDVGLELETATLCGHSGAWVVIAIGTCKCGVEHIGMEYWFTVNMGNFGKLSTLLFVCTHRVHSLWPPGTHCL